MPFSTGIQPKLLRKKLKIRFPGFHIVLNEIMHEYSIKR